jgi:hypothetical protein
MGQGSISGTGNRRDGAWAAMELAATTRRLARGAEVAHAEATYQHQAATARERERRQTFAYQTKQENGAFITS